MNIIKIYKQIKFYFEKGEGADCDFGVKIKKDGDKITLSFITNDEPVIINCVLVKLKKNIVWELSYNIYDMHLLLPDLKADDNSYYLINTILTVMFILDMRIRYNEVFGQ